MSDNTQNHLENFDAQVVYELYQIQPNKEEKEGKEENGSKEEPINLVVLTLHSFLLVIAKMSELSQELEKLGKQDEETEKLIKRASKDIAQYIIKATDITKE